MSKDVPVGYKLTEVGVIPEDWEVKQLENIATLERGKFTARPRNDPKYYGGSIPFIQTGDVSNSNGEISSYSQTLNLEGLKVSKLFQKGTLFFTIAANIGDVGFTSFDTACPDSLVAITAYVGINRTWLFYELGSRKKIFEGLATQNAQLNINLEKLRPYQLSVPPFPEQEAIALVLSDTDALITSLDKLIAKKRDIKQAAMQQLLTGKQRLEGFCDDWEVKFLSEITSYVGSGKSKVNAFNGHPVYGSTGVIGYSDTSDYIGDSILVARVGANAGKLNFVSGQYGVTDNTIIVKLSDIFYLPFFFYQLEIKRLNTLVFGSGQPLITGTQLKSLLIHVPEFEEQQAIAKVLSDMDSEISALEQRRDKTKALKQAMMQELLTGRIRLR